MSNSREVIHKLLYQALVEIRTEAFEIKNGTIFHLADLFHNIPLQLERVAEEGSYDEIVTWLENRAKEKGCEKWLSNTLNQL